ncbi:CDC40 [Mytilus coruscus]|uniref:CDC40 n=1 Tax=Mytilus coruscus TaxID=42192 RepID=A0A6J8ECB3_MYTCO|nr:CDC40 [Mytilus coruscus]
MFFYFAVIQHVQGEHDWIVNEKVSGYGDNLTLFCLIDDCCTKEAGWVKFGPYYETIFLDVRNSKNYTSTDKYAATTNSTGFSLVIKNIQREDINIEYSCVHGFDKSRKKVLLHTDAFREAQLKKKDVSGMNVVETKQDIHNVVNKLFFLISDDETRSELPVVGIIIGSLMGSFIILVAVVVLTLILKRYKSRRKRYGEITQAVAKSSKKDLGVNLLDEGEEMIERQYETTSVSDAESSNKDRCARVNVLEGKEEREELVNWPTIVTANIDGEITQPVAKSSKKDLGVNLLNEGEEMIEQQYETTSVSDGEITQPVAKSSEKDLGVNLLNEGEEMIERQYETTSVSDGEITQPVAKSSKKDLGVNLLNEREERIELQYGTTNEPVAILQCYISFSLLVLILSNCEIKFNYVADIVIIHTEEKHQMQGVESYKCHLEQLSEEMGSSHIIIKLFEDVFSYEQMSSGVEIQTVLAKCHYVFVYISKKFFVSKLKRFGINECWIKDALEKQEAKKRIKILSGDADGKRYVWDRESTKLYSKFKVHDDARNIRSGIMWLRWCDKNTGTQMDEILKCQIRKQINTTKM